MIRSQRHVVFRFRHGHVRHPRQQRNHGAFMGGIEMLHQDKGHTGLAGQMLQQIGHRFQTASRRADADNGECRPR